MMKFIGAVTLAVFLPKLIPAVIAVVIGVEQLFGRAVH